MAIAAAAFEEVDATPMEGFEAEKVDEILGLRERGLRSVTLLPLGYRQEEGDWLVKLKKVAARRTSLSPKFVKLTIGDQTPAASRKAAGFCVRLWIAFPFIESQAI